MTPYAIICGPTADVIVYCACVYSGANTTQPAFACIEHAQTPGGPR